MNWKEFEGRPNRAENDLPRISLNTRGVMRLNRIAHDAMGSPEAVKLLFDDGEMVIGLKPEHSGRSNAFRMKRRRTDNARIVHTLPFLRHFKIRIERTILFNEVNVDKDGVVMLPLEKAIGISKRW